MSLPNFVPPFATTTNCTFKVKNNVVSGGTNSRGNPVISFTETNVLGYAVRETNPQIITTIGASPEETPIKVWIQGAIPANFASFSNVGCELTLGGKTLTGIFRPVSLGHPFVPMESLQFIVGAFKGA